jgi:cytochrome c553
VAATALLGAAPETGTAAEAEAEAASDYAAEAKAFEETLARVDYALRKNPGKVPGAVLVSCQTRRNLAVRLFDMGQRERAKRRLKFCVQTLRIPEKKAVAVVQGPTLEDMKAKATLELERAIGLEPDLENGLAIWRECAACHRAEGWGLPNGAVPQLAGQHRKVVLKQLTDIRAGSRENSLMVPYSSVERIGDAQGLADVAGYIDTLEISVETDKGRGDALDLGKSLYQEHCTRCHGLNGEGKADEFIPRIQAQHYRYLVRQLESIRDGRRQNAHPEMKELIQGFEESETFAILDYVSRLEPPKEFQAPPGWRNPDFSE